MQIEEFTGQGRSLVENILPTLRLLLAQPERDDLLLAATSQGRALFSFLSQEGHRLGLEQLIAPAKAMGDLLERARLGDLQLGGPHISLFVEVCTFIDQGIALIISEGNDERLAASATALEAAVFELIHTSTMLSSEPQAFVGVSSEMRNAFIQESEQLLLSAEQEFVLWDFIAIDHERVSELCRSLRRLKENFSIYDCRDFERLCMALESALNRYLQGEFFQTEYPERTFLRCVDMMREALGSFALTETLDIPHVDEILQAVHGLIRQPLGELLIEAGLVNPQTVDDALALQRTSPITQPRRLGEVLVGMGEVTAEEVENILNHQEHLKQQSEQGGAGLIGTGKEPQVPLFPTEVMVDGQRLARVVSVVKQLAALEVPEKLLPFVQELEQLTAHMSRGIGQEFSHHLQRVVRDLAIQFQKRVHFRLEGTEVMRQELDIEEFADILLPLLRNSVEHGIELPGQRLGANKKKNGRLTLSALRQGEELWLSVEDDGAGFDLKKIARLCVEQKLVGEDELGKPTGAELLQIFLTNQHCDQAGVLPASSSCSGLAAVKKRLLDFNAKMDIWSRPGKGARVTLRIPRAS